VVEGLEVCDGRTLACTDVDPGFDRGTAVCNDTCSGFDYSGCHTDACGNGTLEGSEVCERGDTRDCTTLSSQWTSGVATCNNDCSGWNDSGCHTYVCGDGVIAPDEFCDGNAIDCAALSSRYTSGTARCNASCNGWDESTCTAASVCGNATLDEGEACDGKPIACVDLDPSWSGGTAACLADCTGWDDSSCVAADAPHPVTQTDSGIVAPGVWRRYGPFEVTAGALEAIMTGTGDADLYVRRDAPPTTTAYDCRPYTSGTGETCTLEGPGVFYVAVRGYASPSSAFELTIRYSTGGTIPEPITVRELGTAVRDQWISYGPFDLASGELTAVMTGTGDADLYVRAGAAPTSTAYDCRPYASSTNERCSVAGTQVWVRVHGYEARSDYTLEITYLPAR